MEYFTPPPLNPPWGVNRSVGENWIEITYTHSQIPPFTLHEMKEGKSGALKPRTLVGLLEHERRTVFLQMYACLQVHGELRRGCFFVFSFLYSNMSIDPKGFECGWPLTVRTGATRKQPRPVTQILGKGERGRGGSRDGQKSMFGVFLRHLSFHVWGGRTSEENGGLIGEGCWKLSAGQRGRCGRRKTEGRRGGARRGEGEKKMDASEWEADLFSLNWRYSFLPTEEDESL